MVDARYDVTAYGAAGDGETDDTAAVQAALDDADGTGGVVEFAPGEYRTTHTLLYGSDTVIYGPGATIRFEPSDPDATALVSKSYDGSVETERVSIEHLSVEAVDPSKGNGIGIAKAYRVGVHACWTTGLNWHLVDIAGGKNVIVTDCYAANLETAAYQADNLTSSGGLVVEHPDGSTEDAIVDGTNNGNVSIHNNFADNCGRGIHLHRNEGHDLTVRGNKVRDCSGVGILGDEDMTWHDVIIADNIVEGTGGSSGISLKGSYDNLLIQNNTVRHQGPWGIAVHPDRSSESTMAGVRIAGNTVEGVAGAAVVLNGASGEVTGNYVYDVAVGDEAPDDESSERDSLPEAAGVVVSNCESAVVSRNTVQNADGIGVLVRRGSRDVIVSGNDLEQLVVGLRVAAAGPVVGVDVDSNRVVGGDRGIDIGGASHCRISANVVSEVASGITVAETTDLRVSGNDVVDGDGDDVGVSLRRCTDVNVFGNDVAGFGQSFVLADGTGDLDGEFSQSDVTVDEDCTNVVVRYPASEPPERGAFAVGSTVRNTAPAVGGYVGWVCVADGTPGEWHPYGPIGLDE